MVDAHSVDQDELPGKNRDEDEDREEEHDLDREHEAAEAPNQVHETSSRVVHVTHHEHVQPC